MTTLSNAQLARYGLPPKPTTAHALARWAFGLQHIKQRICGAHPDMRPRRPDTALISPDGYLNQEDTINWVGAVGIDGGYSTVSGEWIVPCIFDGPITQYQDAAVWVGLGGDPNDGVAGNLPQIGTDTIWNNGTKTTSNDAWIDDPPYEPSQMLSWSPVCGDDVQAEVNQTTYHGEIYFYLNDTTSGKYTGDLYNWPTSNGNTADWLVERTMPYSGGLAQFYQASCPPDNPYCLTMNNCSAVQNGTTYNIGSLPTHSVVMFEKGTGKQLAFPGPVHNNVFFNVYWQASS